LSFHGRTATKLSSTRRLCLLLVWAPSYSEGPTPYQALQIPSFILVSFRAHFLYSLRVSSQG
jgi:hypothetical protein